MAFLYVTEYSDLRVIQGQVAPAPTVPPLVDQTPVAIGVGSLQSAAFNAKTKLVGVHTDTICSIAWGTNPTATANNRRLAAGATEYFYVGEPSLKVAVITNT